MQIKITPLCEFEQQVMTHCCITRYHSERLQISIIHKTATLQIASVHAALDESSCREFAIAAVANSAPVITELPSSPKLCPQGPFSGSEVSFALKLEEQSWLGLLKAVQELLETVLMVAPPALMELRIQGFDNYVQVNCHLLWSNFMSAIHTACMLSFVLPGMPLRNEGANDCMCRAWG